jgi:hypothetical protein
MPEIFFRPTSYFRGVRPKYLLRIETDGFYIDHLQYYCTPRARDTRMLDRGMFASLEIGGFIRRLVFFSCVHSGDSPENPGFHMATR